MGVAKIFSLLTRRSRRRRRKREDCFYIFAIFAKERAEQLRGGSVMISIMIKKFLSVLLLLAISAHLNAEVEMIQIKWNAFKCLNICTSLIQDNLNAIRSVSNVQIDPRTGVAVMDWDPKSPFSYEPFRYAAGAVGIKIDDMRIRIRGTIVRDGSNLFLVSAGDGARFLLIGPIKTQPGRYVPRYSLESHPLAPGVQEELLNAERNNFTVVIAGPLYLPSHWPRVLITEQIKIDANDKIVEPVIKR